MYYIEDKAQIVIEDFAMPFGGKLNPKNRWVRLAGIMPWDQIEEIYLRTVSTETGRRAFSSRIAFDSIYIKESENLTVEICVTAIQENPSFRSRSGTAQKRRNRQERSPADVQGRL